MTLQAKASHWSEKDGDNSLEKMMFFRVRFASEVEVCFHGKRQLILVLMSRDQIHCVCVSFTQCMCGRRVEERERLESRHSNTRTRKVDAKSDRKINRLNLAKLRGHRIGFIIKLKCLPVKQNFRSNLKFASKAKSTSRRRRTRRKPV